MTAMDILDTLDDLGEEEFERFRWSLLQVDSPKGSIKRGRLEKASKCDTVDLLVQTYELMEALQITIKVLQNIPRNDLVQRLSITSSGKKDSLVVAEKLNKNKAPSIFHTWTLPPSRSPTSPTPSSPACLDLLTDRSPPPDVMIPVPEPRPITYYQNMLQSNLQDKFTWSQEGWMDKKDEQPLVDIYTELYITAGAEARIRNQHEIRHIEMAEKVTGDEKSISSSNIFKAPSEKCVRTVLTSGIAGIGKTFLVCKFVLDWIERRAHTDAHLVFPFTFHQLNSLKGKRFSLAELVHECIPESVGIHKEALNHIFSSLQSSGNTNYDKSEFKLVFVFDGLDESRLHLDLDVDDNSVKDVTKSTKVETLLRKLISGKLLRSARIWITTRPAAANQIPREFVDTVTEVRGFTDPQKEEYFRKRFKDEDEEQADRIISHIKTSRSLHIMCYIPVFCWITATVLKDLLKTREGGELPKTLTEMYTKFLQFQIDRTKEKYGPERCVKVIKSLAKLAYEQLENGNLIFYEKDLKESGIDVSEASVSSGVFTEIFQDEHGKKVDEVKMFSFVHLSVQEFLAAVYVWMSLINHNRNVMLLPRVSQRNLCVSLSKTSSTKVHRIAIDKALKAPNGQLDLFLRFLLGLSLKTNQEKLHVLLKTTKSSSRTNKITIQYVKKKIGENLSPERSINLFHCLNELNDRSLVEEIQQMLSSGHLSTDRLSPAQWSALVFTLLSSGTDLDVFDLKKYSASEEALLRLLPVLKASNKALLNRCSLSETSCEALASVLACESSVLAELDLSASGLQDVGVTLLCRGLRSPQCGLLILRLRACRLSRGSCEALSSVLGSSSCSLTELDLSGNRLQDSAVTLLSAGLRSPHCSLELLRLSGCGLSEKSGDALSSALSTQASHLRTLDVSDNQLQDAGVNLLSAGLESPNCSLESLSLSSCGVSTEGCWSLASALRSNPSHLRELDLSYNHLGDSGVKLLEAGLQEAGVRLERLRLVCCYLSEKTCELLSSLLSDPSSALTELDLSNNDLQDPGAKLISAALESSHCKVQVLRLNSCNLLRKSCKALSSALSCWTSGLRELDLSNNDLQDSGLKHLSDGLKSPHCRLERLNLAGCLITEEGCSSLASALRSNPSHLRELDLSYNHPGDSGVKLLEAGLQDPDWRLEVLRMDHGGAQRMKPGLKKYAVEPSLDTNTAHRLLKLSDANRKVTWVDQKQSYPDHAERFDFWEQLLCSDGLSGRCYWEVSWDGEVDVAVTYRGLGRKGKSADCKLGGNDQSWSLYCSRDHYSICHRNVTTDLRLPRAAISDRVAVFVDRPAGTLSFYRVVPDQVIHLHTFSTTFTDTPFSAFGLWSNSSVLLCDI